MMWAIAMTGQIETLQARKIAVYIHNTGQRNVKARARKDTCHALSTIVKYNSTASKQAASQRSN